MSFKADDINHNLSLETLLMQILVELKVINARMEEAYETDIDHEDIEDDDH